MTIAATANALQAIAQAVSGINAAGAPAFASYTTLVNTKGQLKDDPDVAGYVLPAVMSWPEQTRLVIYGDNADGTAEYELFVDWGMWVYAARDHQTNTIAGMSTAMTLAQSFIEKLANPASYTVTDGQMILIAGPPTVYVNREQDLTQLFANLETKITYAGIVYHGFKMVLQTKEEGSI